MAPKEKENKFLAGRRSVSLKELTDDVNQEHKKTITVESKTERRVEDIDIELIDTDEINEQLFGYEDLNKIEQSFEEIGNKSIIYVYERDNGRYLCYAGNQRLLASKNRNEKKITCVIDGPEPTEDERIEQLIFMNAQRIQRPYYIAQQLKSYENILRRQGKHNVKDIIEEKFGYKERQQQRYKKILQLPEELQSLFKRYDIPYQLLLDKCSKLPEGTESEFVYVFNNLIETEEMSSEFVNKVFNIVTKKEEKKEEKPKNKTKVNQVFKKVMSLPYFEKEDEIKIPEKDKKEILAQINSLKEYIDRLENACK